LSFLLKTACTAALDKLPFKDYDFCIKATYAVAPQARNCAGAAVTLKTAYTAAPDHYERAVCRLILQTSCSGAHSKTCDKLQAADFKTTFAVAHHSVTALMAC
jgi:hypothetical protein